MAIGKQLVQAPMIQDRQELVATTAPQMSARDWLSLGLLSLIWGGSFFFAKVAVEDIGPLTVVLGRVALAAVILNLLVVGRGLALPRSVAGWTPFIVMGVLNSIIPYSLIFWGEVHIASGLAAILNATTPLFTMLVAHVATADERLTPAKVGGVLIGLLGVIVIMGRDLFEIASSNGLAQLAVLAASLSYGVSGVYG
ncbi:MAG: DMT family transporter, partial [Chloroflexota bacterium]|nr:DMT family transporter [Chloroflexota bacterium]